jgi:hypothetical protein
MQLSSFSLSVLVNSGPVHSDAPLCPRPPLGLISPKAAIDVRKSNRTSIKLFWRLGDTSTLVIFQPTLNVHAAG